MAVTSCYYDRDQVEASVSDSGMGTYTHGYIITTDSEMGAESVVAGAQALGGGNNPLPAQWAAYSYQGDTDLYSYARDFALKRVPETKYLWRATVVWRPVEPGEGSRTQGGDPIRSVTNPVDRDAVVWWDREVTTEVKQKDTTGKCLLNKCGFRYEERAEIEVSRSVLVVECNVATLGDVYYYTNKFEGTVNNSPMTIGQKSIAARACLCREVASSPVKTEQGYVFFTLVFRFVFAKDGENWDFPMEELSRWCNEYVAGSTTQILKDAQGKPVRHDEHDFVPIDANGVPLPEGQDTIRTKWRIRTEENFGLLPFTIAS